MISLSQYLNTRAQEIPAEVAGPVNVLSDYQAALAAMGESGQKAVPALGDMLQVSLTRISDTLDGRPTPESMSRARRGVEEQLSLWADKALQHQKANDEAIQDLLLMVAQAAESTGARDEKFGKEITQLSERLRVVAVLESLPLIRRSIVESAGALTTCVAKMADEGRESVRKLTSEIAEYKSRLQASEQQALIDPLTGLSNRRCFEQQLELCIASRQKFSLLVADLNGFKSANDKYGHLVGDDVLRQFATEFKAQFAPDAAVARWGGDEFVALVTGPAKEGAVRADRVRHWVLGEYKITIDGKTTAVMVDAALGLVPWDGIETGLELFARADREMYKAKDMTRETARV